MSIQDLHELFMKSSGVVTDSRKIKNNCIFFSLQGSNFNGNQFAKSAIENGAMYAVIDEEKYFENKENYIQVDNSLATLQQLANFHRKKVKTKIIGITGSNGKTTTKELINSVLKTHFKTYCTKGNLNNHIGVPLSLLEISENTEFAVIEMGANHIGEIDLLSKIAEPNYGYITNFGKAHLEGFGSEEGVIKGKSELYEFLMESSGFIFYNSDDEKQKHILSNYKNKFGFGKEAGDLNYLVKAENPNIIIEVNNNTFKSTLFGNYNIPNIISAISIGIFLGVPIEKIKNGVSDYISSNNRSQILKINSNNIILDAYNANPSSMLLAIKAFQNAELENKVLILGDMFELGKYADKEHQNVVDLIDYKNYKKVYLVGNNFYKCKTEEIKIEKFRSLDEMTKSVNLNDFDSMNILIKGSRGIGLEKLVNY